jgi:protein-tyrosine phosphatase
MNEITESLWISNANQVRHLPDDHQFDEVVTLAYMDFLELGLPEASTTGDTLLFKDGPHDYEKFEAAVDYVLDALEAGDTVLVHCQAGISRSGGVCSAALAIHKDLPGEQALSIVQQARSEVHPESEIRASMKRYIDEYTAKSVKAEQ